MLVSLQCSVELVYLEVSCFSAALLDENNQKSLEESTQELRAFNYKITEAFI